jgi:hypothetical protein
MEANLLKILGIQATTQQIVLTKSTLSTVDFVLPTAIYSFRVTHKVVFSIKFANLFVLRYMIDVLMLFTTVCSEMYKKRSSLQVSGRNLDEFLDFIKGRR